MPDLCAGDSRLEWSVRSEESGDANFLRELFAQTAPGLQSLPAELRVSLTEMQYRGRAMSYAAQYPEARNEIAFLPDGTAVARHLLNRTAAELRGVDLAVLPVWQGRGIGTGLLLRAAAEARALGVPFTLRVVKGNPALRLYLRLGFETVTEDELALEMIFGERATVVLDGARQGLV